MKSVPNFGTDGHGNGSVQVLYEALSLIVAAASVAQVYHYDAFGNLLNFASGVTPMTTYLYSGEAFDFNLGPVVASGDIENVGGQVGFDMKSPAYDLGQGDFFVKVTKLDRANHSFTVRTLGGHPLAGWRQWNIWRKDENYIVVDTFSVEHAATEWDGVKLLLGGLKGMYDTWDYMLNDIANFSGGEIDHNHRLTLFREGLDHDVTDKALHEHLRMVDERYYQKWRLMLRPQR